MCRKTGRYAIIEQFLKDGIDHMFGNPGTVEQGFLDVLQEFPDMKYILTLQESIALLMADGYARATQKPTLVQLHSSPGIGNAVGALYQAKRGHSPLVVIGGDAGLKYMNMDAQMANDLVSMMAPVTKYSTMVMDSRSLLRTLRRAVKIAATPPMGPVYVCLPADVLDEVNSEDIVPTSFPSTRVVPEPGLISKCTEMLLAAEKPRIFIGDGVAWSGASEQLTRVAEMLGAEVYGVDTGDFNMDTTHPLYKGTTGHMFGSHSLPITSEGDVNLIIGTYMVPEVFPELGDIFSPDARVIHFDLNSYEIAKNHRVDLGVVCDPLSSLSALGQSLSRMMDSGFRKRAETRIKKAIQLKNSERNQALERDSELRVSDGLSMAQFARVLSEKLPDDGKTVIFDEALTSSPELNRYVQATIPGSVFTTRGGSLGVGIPGAIGAKTADPGKRVIGFTGDGGSMYTIQALWSAARHKTGAKFVVCNNGSYRLLQMNLEEYRKETNVNKDSFPVCFDLSWPPIDFVGLAESMGVDAVKVEKPEDIAPAIERMLSDDKPFLIDLVIKGNNNPDLVNIKCGQ